MEIYTENNEQKLKQIFSGELQAHFQTNSLTLDKHLVKRVEKAEGMHFVSVSKPIVKTHVPGLEYQDDNIAISSIDVQVDNQIYASFSIPEEDLLKHDPQLRYQAAEELSIALSKEFDKRVIQAGLSSVIPGNVEQHLNITGSKKEKAILDVFKKSWKYFCNHQIPIESTYAILKPEAYMWLMENTEYLNNNFLSGANRGLDTGNVLSILGIKIFESTAFPTTSAYRNTCGMIFHKKSIGTVMLQNFKTEKYYEGNTGAYIYRVKMICNHSAIEPQGVIRIEAPST